MNSNSEYVHSLVFETASAELGIDLKTVEAVFKAQVQYTSRKIGEGTLETIMWPRIGKFRPKMKEMRLMDKKLATADIRKATKTPTDGTP